MLWATHFNLIFSILLFFKNCRCNVCVKLSRAINYFLRADNLATQLYEHIFVIYVFGTEILSFTSNPQN